MGHFHAYLHNGKAKVLFIGGSWIFKRSHGAAVRNSGATKVFKGLHLCTYDSTQNMQQVWPHLQVPRKKNI